MSAVIEVKTIKPQRIKVKEIRLELLNELRRQGKEIEREYAKTVETWRNKPDFATAISLSGGDAAALVGPQGRHAQQYEWVDKGTRPHIIRPRRAPRLRFRTGYRAKTRPGVIGSTTGGATGDVVYAREVRHPGNQARGFSELIEARRRRPFHRSMIGAIQRGAAKSLK